MQSRESSALHLHTVPRSGLLFIFTPAFSSLVVRRRGRPLTPPAKKSLSSLAVSVQSYAAGVSAQMRISTISASELLMLLNVLSGAFGSSEVSAVKIKLAD